MHHVMTRANASRSLPFIPLLIFFALSVTGLRGKRLRH